MKQDFELQAKVNKEYELGYNYIRQERERKRNILKKVLDVNVPDNQVRVNLLWQNMQLEEALFLNDELNIVFLTENGVLGEDIVKNANLVAKYDFKDLELKEIQRTIIQHNALYGLGITIVDGYDEDENQPIVDVINPLNAIFDPQNFTGSKMRFFGVERRVSKDFLLNNPAFDVSDDMFATSFELDQNKRYEANANNSYFIVSDDGLVDIYDHFTIYKGKKILTTWANNRTKLIRYIEIEPLTKAEKLKPLKTEWPIVFHRRKPKYGSVFGVSIADEVLNYQDAISKLTNLQLLQANQLALGPDTFVDSKIGVNIEVLSKSMPGGRIIPVDNKTGMPTQNGIFHSQLPSPSGFISQMIKELEARATQTTNISQQVFGISPPGNQTKGEIQTLQQNANQILMWIASNYMDGIKDLWYDIYKSYVLNFKGTKFIALYDNGKTIAKKLKRDDFIADGKVIIEIASKSQSRTENDQDFNKLMVIANLYLPNMKPGYSTNEFLRALIRKSNIKDINPYTFIPETIDELDAKNNLRLINRNIEVPGPQPGQDLMTYILIYRQALDTEAKWKVLQQYEMAYMLTGKQEQNMQETLKGNGAIAGIAMNNINQQANSMPSNEIVKNTM